LLRRRAHPRQAVHRLGPGRERNATRGRAAEGRAASRARQDRQSNGELRRKRGAAAPLSLSGYDQFPGGAGCWYATLRFRMSHLPPTRTKSSSPRPTDATLGGGLMPFASTVMWYDYTRAWSG